MRAGIIAAGFLVVFIALAGCTADRQRHRIQLTVTGVLSVACAPVTTGETVLFTNETYTKSKIVMHTQSGDVVTYLSAPKQPTAAMVFVPGAGEKIAGHEERMVRYADAGIAFLFVDIRGNGGETPGYPLNPQLDFNRFEKGDWPQYYLTICDLVASQKVLSDRLGVPVYVTGSSNGGRYAAVAAGS